MYRLMAICLIVVLCAATLTAQESILRLRPYDGTPGSYLNAQLAADTAVGGIIPANRVYVLTRGGNYLVNGTFRVNAGQILRMRANDSTVSARPNIYLYPTGTGANPQRPPGNFIDLRGKMYFRNLNITGYFEPLDTNLNNLQGGLINVPTAGAGADIIIDSCLLSNSNGNHIRTDGATNLVIVTNSIFANMGFLGTSNLGAGKAIDVRDASCDTLIFQNCTFVNWQDRIIRHYNFANPLAGTGPINYLKFDHNTLANGMSYHGLFSLGSMGKWAYITNNLLVDPFSLGNDTDVTRQSEFVNSGEKDAFGGARMNWVFTTPNDSTTWTIKNNFYAISDSGVAFYNAFAAVGVTGEGAPLTWHINSKIGIDSTTAFTKLAAGFTLTNAPKLMTALNRWYRNPAGGNKLKNTPNVAWNRSYDYDRRLMKYYTDTLNGAYSTGSPAYTGGIGGYPAGDLNWFPARKAAWLTDPTSVEEEGVVPESFTMTQNYPNPFNPATRITFTVPFESRVKLEVFDLLGRSVATLVDGPMTFGVHHADFDASRLGSGTYFYRLTAGTQVISKKMLLLK